MKRRDFLRTGALTSAAALIPTGAEAVEKSTIEYTADDFELEEKTIADLQRDMATGKRTSQSITNVYLERINSIDKRGPKLNSVIEINPDAMSIARALDAERKSRGPRGPMHGIPVLIKDNIDTADRMMTTAGSLALEGSHPERDAFIAQRLREAGAVIIGKTNLSEWANFRSTHSTSGWSGRGGQTKNPYVLDRNPCGSSSGSGAAIAANLCAVAVGTETDGSVTCPAAINGIVGLKPTIGLVSRSGIIPISHTQDTAGPMTRTVADNAILLNVLAGVDPRDSSTTVRGRHASPDYTQFLDANALKGARIGVPREKYYGYNDATDKVCSDAIELMKSRGAIIVDPANLPHAGEYDDAEFEVLLYDFKTDLNKYLASLGPGARVKSMADVIAFNEREKSREMPWFGQEIMLMAEKKGSLQSSKYLTALAKCRRMSRTDGIDAIMNQHRLDALVAPVTGPAWPTDLINGDHFIGGSTTPAAVAGYPNITVPAGFVSELPIGLSFFGRAWSEPKLIALAYSFEQASRHRRRPKFISSLLATESDL
jgi:amidase